MAEDPHGRVRWVSGIDVRGSTAARTVVAFGDSITEGAATTVGANRGWVDLLDARVGGGGTAVVNAGIGGNTITPRSPNYGENTGPVGQARFGHDALQLSGVASVLIAEGTNDLCLGASAATIIAGLTDLAQQARAAGAQNVVGATIILRGGSNEPCTTGVGWIAYQQARQQVNQWMRTTAVSTGLFSTYVDFDAAVRDPSNPEYIKAGLFYADRIHPNDAGHAAMAAAVPASLFGG